jgi:hypothetical protein
MLVLLSAANPIAAQNNPPSQIKPRPVHTTPINPDGTSRPTLQTPAETAKAMAQAERLSIQSDLAWTGNYNGIVNGEVSDRMVVQSRRFRKGVAARKPVYSIHRSARRSPMPHANDRPTSAGR